MLKKILIILVVPIIFGLVITSQISSSALTYRIPYEACEISKSYPTLATEIKAGPLTNTLLLVDCQIVEHFPSITAAGGGEFYTPIGQYTVDYKYMREVAYLNNPIYGVNNLRTPFWMTYTKMAGDYGEYAGRNLFGVHGAPWRTHKDFTGEKEIWLGGSHGCTNIEDPNAEIIFDYVTKYKNQGTKVKVFNYTYL